MVMVSEVVSQLQDNTVTDWVSDSSMSKLVYGRLSRVVRNDKGITLVLSNERKVNWRLPAEIADQVISDMRSRQEDADYAFTKEEEWLQKGNY